MQVTTEGITNWQSDFGQPDYNSVYAPFSRWMDANHPEAPAQGFGDWTSVEQAQRFGELHADFAKQWAAYLIANGCTYEDVAC